MSSRLGSCSASCSSISWKVRSRMVGLLALLSRCEAPVGGGSRGMGSMLLSLPLARPSVERISQVDWVLLHPTWDDELSYAGQRRSSSTTSSASSGEGKRALNVKA